MANETFRFFGKNIIIISSEGWGDNFLSKHHIALTLAKLNNTIWFISPFHSSAPNTTVAKLSNVNMIRYKPLRGISKLPRPFARLATWFEVRKIKKIVNNRIDIAWSFDPYLLQFLKLFDAEISIYHPVDNHYTKLEDWVLREADILFTNSNQTFSRVKHKNKSIIGHGVAPHFFESTFPIALPGKFKVKAGYVGNLNNKLFDFELFLKLAKEHPKVGFYLIGPRGSSNLSSTDSPLFNWGEIDKLPNVFWMGQQPSTSIPSYIGLMDILLILYKPDEKGLTVNAHKTLEYLSSGNLIVTAEHDDNRPIEHLILQSKTLPEIPALFECALKNLDNYQSSEIRKSRIKFALSKSYENRIQEMEEAIRRL